MNAVLVFEDAFHGRTLLALSMTSKVRPYKAGFGPFIADVHRVPYAYCYRCPLALHHPSCGLECAEFARKVIRHETTGALAAILVEPIQGEAGVLVDGHDPRVWADTVDDLLRDPQRLDKLSSMAVEHAALPANRSDTGVGGEDRDHLLRFGDFLVGLGQELVQRRIEQADGHRQAGHVHLMPDKIGYPLRLRLTSHGQIIEQRERHLQPPLQPGVQLRLRCPAQAGAPRRAERRLGAGHHGDPSARPQGAPSSRPSARARPPITMHL